tara:strand:+ start:92 stop:253 length:162 start_codon:yes stop_codon:yes gene_type:complete
MIVSLLDCIYLGLFVIVFGFIIHMETQLKMLLEMMKEHVKTDRLCDLKKSLEE